MQICIYDKNVVPLHPQIEKSVFMKKCILILAMIVAAMGTMADGLSYYNPTMLRMADGSTILTYKTLGNNINPQTGVPDTDRYFYLHMQVMDPSGTPQFPAGGVIVSSQPTRSAALSLTGLDTLSNGNIVMTHADIRMQPTDSACNPYVYAYCYSRQGTSAWSSDGVMLPVLKQHTNAVVRSYLGEQIAVSGDYIYFAAMVQESVMQDTGQHTGVQYFHYFEIACMDYSGNILASNIEPVNDAFQYKLCAGPNSHVYVVYVNDNEGYSARLVGPDCQNSWPEEAVVDTLSVVRRSGTAAAGHAPREMKQLPDGSLMLLYDAYANVNTSALFYNRLMPDGTLFGHRALLTDTVGLYEGQVDLIDGDTLYVVENRLRPISQTRSEYYRWYNAVRLSDGAPLLTDPYGAMLDMTYNAHSDLIGLVKADGRLHLIAGYVDSYYGTNRYYSYTFDQSSNRQLVKSILGDIEMSDHAFACEDPYGYIFYSKGENGTDSVWFAAVDVTDLTDAVPQTGEMPAGKFTVGADGKRVVFSQGNLQYLPYRDTYHFATKQWETLTYINGWLSDTDINWMDLYGWGTGDQGDKTDTIDANYAVFTDWGTNAVLNSSYDAGTWRTLDADEWTYLLSGRPDAASKRALGSIVFPDYEPTVNGLILLPDTFVMPDTVQMKMNAQSCDANAYLPYVWMELEANGAVFLPMDGYRRGTVAYEFDNAYEVGTKGLYWTASGNGTDQAYCLTIDSTAYALASLGRATGLSVRLVKDTDAAQGLEEIVNRQSSNRKFINDGQIFILRDDKVYNMMGIIVK